MYLVLFNDKEQHIKSPAGGPHRMHINYHQPQGETHPCNIYRNFAQGHTWK